MDPAVHDRDSVGARLVAAFVSYRHALQVVRAHGESGVLALAYR